MSEGQVEVEQYKAEQALKGAMGWLTAIGIFSLINSVVAMNDSKFTFVIGLGIAQIGDVMLANSSAIWQTLGLFVAYGFGGLFVLLGWLTKHWLPAMFIGLGLYALDSVIFLVAQDWLGLGFHAFAAFGIIRGYMAYRELRAKAAGVAVGQAPAVPQELPVG